MAGRRGDGRPAARINDMVNATLRRGATQRALPRRRSYKARIPAADSTSPPTHHHPHPTVERNSVFAPTLVVL